MNGKLELWQNWRRLVNVQPEELGTLSNSDIGHQASRLAKSLEEGGHPSWRKSARVLPTMIALGRTSFDAALHGWAGEIYSGIPLWLWAKYQVAQISDRLAKPLTSPVQVAIIKMWGHDPHKALVPQNSQHVTKFTRADGLYFYRGMPVSWEDPRTQSSENAVFIYAVLPEETISNSDVLALVQSNIGHRWVAIDWLRPALSFGNQTVGIHMPCLPKDREGEGRNYCVYKEKPQYRGQATPPSIDERKKRIMKNQPKGFPKHTSSAKEAKHLIKMMKTYGKG